MNNALIIGPTFNKSDVGTYTLTAQCMANPTTQSYQIIVDIVTKCDFNSIKTLPIPSYCMVPLPFFETPLPEMISVEVGTNYIYTLPVVKSSSELIDANSSPTIVANFGRAASFSKLYQNR